MKKTLNFLFFVVVFSANLAAQTPSKSIIDSIQKILNTCTEVSATGSVLRVEKVNEWSYTFKSGVSNIAKNTPIVGNEKFRAGSVSKNFLATCILKLASENKLNLNDTLGKWLPKNLTTIIPNAQKITIRHLLNHTSGLADGLNNDKSGLLDEVLANTKLTIPFDTLMFKYYKKVAKMNFAPSKKNGRHTNTGFWLLGEIVKKVTGQTYDSYMKQLIFTPLNLQNTYIPAFNDTIIKAPFLHGYEVVDSKGTIVEFTNQNMSWANSAGSIISNVEDLATYYKALRNGQIIPQNWVDSMMTVNVNDLDIPVSKFGLGVFEIKQSPYQFIGHTGGVPGYATMMFYLPKYKLYVTGNFTSSSGDNNCVLKEITDLLEKAIVPTQDINSTNNLKIFPNPASDEFTMVSVEQSDITIVNGMGQIVLQTKVEIGQNSINIVDLPNGIYTVLSIQDKDASTLRTQKLIIQH